ncbi:MAG TPA: hypothetical protein DG048_11220 [Pseudoalteromonas sp.]|nr:hypothetical protein [Pseudoalteromonas sp.]|tara:strand:- start:1944 stop:2375 length:432 start_codon:yes stop_codon:yes gene_type:complete
MNREQFNAHRKEFFEEAMSLSDAKAVEYTISNKDRLYNFKHVGSRLGINPKQAALTYILKHVDALCNDAKTGQQFSDETFRSRCLDISNYMVLITALHAEEKTPQPNEDNTKPSGDRNSIIGRNSANDTEPKKWNKLVRQKKA